LQFFVWSSRSGVTTPSMASLPSRAFRGASFGRSNATLSRVGESPDLTLRRSLSGQTPIIQSTGMASRLRTFRTRSA
jgi:hypothetical protein